MCCVLMHVLALQVSSYRILEQIPAARHTLYLCGFFNSAGVVMLCAGIGCYRAGLILPGLHSQIVPPAFFKSHDITVTFCRKIMHIGSPHICSCEV